MSPSNNHDDIDQILLEVHRKSIELAIDRSIRTGTPLVIEKNGKIVKIPPKYKYVRVPINDSLEYEP